MTAPVPRSPDLPPLEGLPVLVYSLGIEGRDLARWLVAHGARVTISDTRDEAALAAAGAVPPEGVERVVIGQPLLDPAGFGLVAVSQSILRYNPALARARELGIPITSQMRLFLQLCPGRTIGITGSSGKSTTTALVGAMAREAGIEFVLGGNIGEPLLAHLDEIRPSTTVILEISHTQLQYTDRSPHIAAVTNVTPNHLDQFSWDEYVGLKRNHIAHQSRDDVAVLNQDNPVTRAFMASVRGRLVATSIEAPLQLDGAFIDGGEIVIRRSSRVTPVVPVADVRMRGRHNLANAVMACAIAAEAGWPVTAMARAIRTFTGVPHRLEVVGRAGGATWVNDSIATSPERTVAGLRAFDEPVVLLLGGRDKHLPLDVLQEAAAQRCRAVVCFGEAGPLFHGALADRVDVAVLVDALEDAVAAAAGLARPGDVVLFAPAGTSFDRYPNFEARGEHFRQLVRQLPGFTVEVSP
ncbi:UDP-N-acetylmuramoyl-L-alanine--D-glutamate ligase [Tepidiforma thermophila]|uniref:UDP-N-acetylmuramoylalanine--D-glutamate ligase n=1 Tax=Tepidiforma thermophila (strain KCTC 52669 / CGMCC 1.13589 / G233) TaxID=2761530 RepID=A0A2A9HDX3_TEPT2|nr:UDP-N-acetylmuramoyl-L-alanine--D-glutamate ligase [Tepidiforma thermophila]PFG74204.1 UDP-N-acetylmuramoylalanine--D-glutamate ligase [Tepidiforma thermophila]